MKKFKDYYQKGKNWEPQLPRNKVAEEEWLLAEDIQREYLRQTGEFIDVRTIGRMAKAYCLSKDSGYGFKLYHKSLVNILVRGGKNE